MQELGPQQAELLEPGAGGKDALEEYLTHDICGHSFQEFAIHVTPSCCLHPPFSVLPETIGVSALIPETSHKDHGSLASLWID